MSYRPASLCSLAGLAESIPGLLKRLEIRAPDNLLRSSYHTKATFEIFADLLRGAGEERRAKQSRHLRMPGTCIAGPGLSPPPPR